MFLKILNTIVFKKFRNIIFKNSDVASVVIGSERRVLRCRRMDPFSTTSGSKVSDAVE
jgi:hypothetical protein